MINIYGVEHFEKVKSILDVMLEMIEVWEFKAVPITVIIGTALKRFTSSTVKKMSDKQIAALVKSRQKKRSLL